MSKKLLFNNSDNEGTEQEGEWVDANMRLGAWATVNNFVAEEYEYSGLYHHASEVIYLDGLKEIHAQGVTYNEDIGVGVTVFGPDGANAGTLMFSELVNAGTNVMNVSTLYEAAQNAIGSTIIAISFAVYVVKNTAALRYKLIR